MAGYSDLERSSMFVDTLGAIQAKKILVPEWNQCISDGWQAA